MDESVRRFREAREQAGQAAQDFLSANPGCAGVVVVRGGVSLYRNQAGVERVCVAQEKDHEQRD